ncbi:MAG TPA: alpha/beta family hydrolase [Gammaproteobacteria bacterium]|nr:alpha/beta family hydrolase [Gammaproteobacteria bacterium]
MRTWPLESVIVSGSAMLHGDLLVPDNAQALIVFAHGSGSSRYSPRNRLVAGRLNAAGFGTLLCDLLSAEEHMRDAVTSEYRFDVPLLAQRLVDIIDWTGRNERTSKLPFCLFGASTGSAAALIAAAERPQAVKAVVSRGGRPDLAGERLEQVKAPTLLVVGSRDELVLELNEQALSRMHALGRLVVIPGASHLFEEPGMLEDVARHAVDWFRRYSRSLH